MALLVLRMKDGFLARSNVAEAHSGRTAHSVRNAVKSDRPDSGKGFSVLAHFSVSRGCVARTNVGSRRGELT